MVRVAFARGATVKALTLRQVEACAQAAHEVNRAYCAALGDVSQPAWTSAPVWQIESAINGVHGVMSGNGPRESHESWLEEKRRTGWKYGPIKDPEKKEHPCFVAYDDLPPEQKQKDDLYIATVTAMARAFGVEVTKRDPAAKPPPGTVGSGSVIG